MNASAGTHLHSVAEAADRLGLATRTVYQLVADGRLTACRIGRRLLISSGDLEQFIARHRVTTPRAADGREQ